MATPRPTSATRNSTMNDTLVISVIGYNNMNVNMIDAIAINNGSSARNDPNTKARTSNAPPAPSKVSPSTPGPLLLSPTASASSPVTPTVAPGGAAALAASLMGV